MRSLPRLAEQMARAPRDHLLAVSYKGGDDVAQGQELGPPTIQRQHVDAKARLQRGVAVELVEDDIRLGVALDLDDDAQPFAIALVAQLGDAFDHLFPYGLGDALD